MIPSPFFSRLVAPFAVVLIIFIAAGGIVIEGTGERVTRLRHVEDLHRLALLAREAPTQTKPENTPARSASLFDGAIFSHLAGAGRGLGARVTLFDGADHVLFDTANKSATASDAVPEIQQARRLNEANGAALFAEDTRNGTTFLAERVEPQRSDGPVIRLGYADAGWPGLAEFAWPLVDWSVLAAFLVVAVPALLVRWRWIGPTRDLTKAAEQMAAGQWGRRVEPGGSQELRFFTTRLNLVASQAQQQLAVVKHQRADLQALVDTLPDPILVTDAAGKLILINPPAARLVEMPEPRVLGEPFVQVVSDEAILQLFDRVRANAKGAAATGDARTRGRGDMDAAETREYGNAGTSDDSGTYPTDDAPVTRDVRLNRAGQWLTYQAVAKLTPGGGVLLMLRDVSALTAAVQMKTDFVANASHELRTPIAAIKIAFETLREVYGDDASQSQRCMIIIDGHLRRLEEMLRDLLDLSKVERENIDPIVRYLKTFEVFAQIRLSLGPMARQKGVEVRLGEDGEQADEFLADEVLLNLVLKNLLENSIKFTPPGGCVRLNFRLAADPAPPSPDGVARRLPVVLSVVDTGIGIPPEHLDRVFERFYQVDPARSGSAGRGTGLGLAIVKHAIAALGGTVQIQSKVNEGTTVICVLPQDNPAPAPDDVESHELAVS